MAITVDSLEPSKVVISIDDFWDVKFYNNGGKVVQGGITCHSATYKKPSRKKLGEAHKKASKELLAKQTSLL